jgi:hypothetical protein
MTDHTDVLKALVGHLRGVALVLNSTANEAAISRKAPARYSELTDRIRNPKPGDLVAEVSSFLGGELNDLNAVGHLVEIKQEPGETQKTFIKTLDGRVVEWTNCHFLGLPDTMPRD